MYKVMSIEALSTEEFYDYLFVYWLKYWRKRKKWWMPNHLKLNYIVKLYTVNIVYGWTSHKKLCILGMKHRCIIYTLNTEQGWSYGAMRFL